MTENRSLPKVPGSVPIARHFVTGVIADAPRELIDRVAVMVSELATNAIQHAGTDFVIEVERTADSVSVAVSDAGDGEPTIRDPEPSEHSGRGLRIVEALSDEWGVRPVEDGRGKTVWFAVQLTTRRVTCGSR